MTAFKEFQIKIKGFSRPKCPECGKVCRLSKLSRVWLCRNCNQILRKGDADDRDKTETR